MLLQISKQKLLDILTIVGSAIERRHTINILSNVKIQISKDQLIATGSDLEVELKAKCTLNDGECIVEGETTIPARKLLEICKSLPPQAILKLTATEDDRCIITSGKSKFTIGTRPTDDFPMLLNGELKGVVVEVEQSELKRLFDKTAFAMAVQDVRFYLTGTLLEISPSLLKAVTTDGHRMAICETVIESNTPETKKVIIPRKGVSEIQRLVAANNKKLKLYFSNEFLHAEISQTTKDGDELTVFLTTKLIDGKFPDYSRVIPTRNDKKANLTLADFKDCLTRVAILSNEKIKGIILTFAPGELLLSARNPEQDEAIESLQIEYEDEQLEISFNGQYLIDVLNNIGHSEIEIQMASENESVLLKNPSDSTLTYVVMPMRA